jgi:CDP-glucose 4,6-dehydratase
MSFGDYFQGKRVLVTGHTGFKGSWLASWLLELGADVYGLALPPTAVPSLFDILQLQHRMGHEICDVGDYTSVALRVKNIRPQVIFHLAAQALVRLSYEIPLQTLNTNVMGTAHVLQAVAEAGYSSDAPCIVVIITSDKCYENRETYQAYREDDPVGGFDVYSMSKGAAELVTSSWRRSFFNLADSVLPKALIASCRAGNVIGGGDWSSDRIVPDAMRALAENRRIPVRNPLAIRPWQHVLEPLSGYLRVASLCGTQPEDAAMLCSAWNFGPGRASERTVGELCDALVRHWGAGNWDKTAEGQAVHEARFLKLAVDKAWHFLAWQPVWDFQTTIAQTVNWYRTALQSGYQAETMIAKTREQIGEYVYAAAEAEIEWAD